MNTFLLPWNSKRLRWDTLGEMSTRVKYGERVTYQWNISHKKAQIGDRVFLMRLGEEPKGIFASGRIIRPTFERLNLEEERLQIKEKIISINLEFDILLNPEIDAILERDQLINSPLFMLMNWDAQGSGFLIRDEIAKNLEERWKEFGRNTSQSSLTSIEKTGLNLYSDCSREKGTELKEQVKEIGRITKEGDNLEIVTSTPKGNRQRSNAHTFRPSKDLDYAGQDARNKELGLAGEKLVLELEKQQLIKLGRKDLAEKVRLVSETLGDGAGYDVASFSADGESKYIEVKTTSGAKVVSFFMSSNELAFAQTYKDNYYLYRVFEYDKNTNTAKCFILKNIEEELNFSPIQFRVSLISANT